MPLRSLPKGLVGVKCTAQIIIGGKEVDCFLDTGSQVTAVPQSFYESYLSDLPLKLLENLLEVEGANGKPCHTWGTSNWPWGFRKSL